MSLTVILPTVNEAQSLPILVPEIRHYVPTAEIIVVDDGSTDDTVRIAQNLNCKVITRPRRLGIVSAFRDGVIQTRTEFVALMDADGQHDPAILPQMLSKMASHYLVVGSRYAPGGDIPDWSFIRRLISDGAIAYTHFMVPSTKAIKDITSGYIMMWSGIAQSTYFKYPNSWKVLPEIISQNHDLGTKPTEVGYIFATRKNGKSKLKRSTIWKYFIHVLKVRERFRL